MVPDELIIKPRTSILDVSIRFKARDGFRLADMDKCAYVVAFQSALRFAVVSDIFVILFTARPDGVSIRFEVCGGFRQ